MWFDGSCLPGTWREDKSDLSLLQDMELRSYWASPLSSRVSVHTRHLSTARGKKTDRGSGNLSQSCLSIPEVLVGSYCTFFLEWKGQYQWFSGIFSENFLFKETLTGAKCIQMVYGLCLRGPNQSLNFLLDTTPTPAPTTSVRCSCSLNQRHGSFDPESPLAECPSPFWWQSSPTYMTRVVGQPHPVKRQLEPSLIFSEPSHVLCGVRKREPWSKVRGT